MIGKTISHYQITEQLGAGGMGVVYKARDTRLDRDVAVKFLPKEVGADDSARARFTHEARAASALDHANITTIFDIDQTDDGQMFIVMAYHDGRSLRDIIDRDRPDVDGTIDIVAQIAAGLDRAHENDIVHRDVKPGNIIVTGKGEVRIVDFGLAKLAGQTRVTREGSTVGTAAYMSPEQARGEEVDGRSDVFSLGVVLYELLTGSLPFKGEHDAAILYNIVHTEAAPLPADLAALQPIVTRALAKSPGDRYQSAAEMRRDLERARSGHALPPVAAADYRKGWWLRLTAFIVVVAIIGWFASQRMNRTDGAGGDTPPAARSDRPPATNVMMSQVTFARGVEEFPAFSPDGARIAFCADDESGLRQVLVRDIESREQTSVTAGGYDHIQPTWSADGETIVFVRARAEGRRLEPGDVFGTYAGGDIWSHVIATGEETRVVENAFAPAFSPDGKRLAFDADWGGSSRIYVADGRGRNPLQVTTDSSEVADHLRPRWSRDGSKIVFQWTHGTRFDIQSVDVKSREQVWITNDLFQDLDPEWDPVGDVVYFSSARTGGLNVWRVPVDARGAPAGRLEQVTTGSGQDVQVTFARDGTRLALTVMRQNADLYALPVSQHTGEAEPPPYSLESTTREDSRGAWSPDAKNIAFNSDRGGNMNIYVKAIVGGGERQFTEGPGGDYQPDWSPDQTRLVFFSSRAGNADIWEIYIADGAMRRLTRGPSLERNPAYSPNGRWIAYQSDADGRMELWVMRADGSEQRALTNIGVTGHFLLWMSDSDRVIFSSRTAAGTQQYVATVSTGAVEKIVDVAGGSHMSFSPDQSLILDVTGHKTLWVTPLDGGEPVKVFEFDDPDNRIDYPRWSPDGRLVMFDLVKPSGGDIWVLEGL